MCFSASASFITGGGLTVLGIASWRLAKKKERLVASVPLLFAAQQVIEGFQWKSFELTGIANSFLSYAYIFFAFLLWPIHIPFIVYTIDAKNRKTGRWFLLAGTIILMALLWTLASSPLIVSVVNECISYQIESIFPPILTTLYVITVCGSMIVSKIKEIKFFGLLTLLFAIFTAEVYTANFVSVWCFFAAVLSGLIYVYFWNLRRK